MSLFDILGPIMVGPSSSHTAGAVKIGYVARKLLKEPVQQAEILLYGSFLATGRGHGTPQAIVAGLLGMKPDDIRIPNSLQIAEQAGIGVRFGEADLQDAHPNSVKLRLQGSRGRRLDVVGESIGGSRINIASIDGLSANFSGDHPTLIVHNLEQPGHVAEVTGRLAMEHINVAMMQLYRAKRGGNAVMILECDQEIPQAVLDWLVGRPGIEKVTYYGLEDAEL